MTLKDAKSDYIVEVAKTLFLEKGINNVCVKDLASRAELGEATIYRYFSKKENLVSQVAINLEKEVFNKYFSINHNLSGYVQIERFYNCFLDVFTNVKNYFRFVHDFDSLIVANHLKVEEYENNIYNYYQVFMEAYNKGLEDGSVKKLVDPNLFYMTTSHAILSLCVKMSSEDVLVQDSNADKTKEICELIMIFMNSLIVQK